MKYGERERELIFLEDDKYPEEKLFTGITLGWDFTAEHEFSCETLNYALGIDDPDKTLESRRITQSNNLFFERFDNVDLHTISPPTRKSNEPIIVSFAILNINYPFIREHLEKDGDDETKRFERHLHHYNLDRIKWSRWSKNGAEEVTSSIHCSWDDRSAQIVVGEDNIPYLKKLYEEILARNAVFYILKAAMPAFANGSLGIFIADRIPQEHWEKAREEQREQEILEDAIEESGIHKTVDDAGLRYYALAGRFKNDKKKELVFWLNPSTLRSRVSGCHQPPEFAREKGYEPKSGWYSIEELLLWVQGKGPVIHGRSE